MPPNVATFRPAVRPGPALFHGCHYSALADHDGVRFVGRAPTTQEDFFVQKYETGVDSFALPFPANGLKPVTLKQWSALHGTQSSLCNETDVDQGGGIAKGGGGSSHNATVPSAAASFSGVTRSDRRSAVGTSSVTDQILAVVILNLVACAIWALAAFPLFREGVVGSVTALPWWLWAGFSVVMGGIAGGQVR